MTALPAPLLPFIRNEFSLDYTQSGLVISAFTVAYGIGQIPAGWLADRIGPRILIVVSICGVALAGVLVGLSQTHVMLAVFLAMMGLLGGGYHPSSPPLILASVEKKNQGRALGIHSVGGGASHFLAPLLAAVLVTFLSWRGTFIALAIPALIFGIIFYVFLRRLATRSKAGAKLISGDSQALTEPGRVRRLTSVIVMSTATQGLTFSVVAFIPLYLVDHFGFGAEAAAALLAVIFSAGLWAGPLGGYLSDRLGKVPVLLAVCLSSGLIIYLLNVVPYGFGIGVVLVLIGMILYAKMPVIETYIVGHTSERHRSSVLGFSYFGNMEGAGVLTPVVGYLIDQFGFQSSFTIVAVAMIAVNLVCSVLLWGSRD